jgi:hypothetical protein
VVVKAVHPVDTPVHARVCLPRDIRLAIPRRLPISSSLKEEERERNNGIKL